MPYFDERDQSAFAATEEIQALAKPVDWTTDRADCGGLPVYHEGQMSYVLDHDCHVLLSGSSGSMKTQRGVLPLIESLSKHGESLILSDPKGELYTRTRAMLQERGYRIWVLNLRSPWQGLRWNPLGYAGRLYQAGERDRAATAIEDVFDCLFRDQITQTKDVFFPAMAQGYGTGLAHMLCQEGHGDCLTLENVLLADKRGMERMERMMGFGLKLYCENKARESSVAVLKMMGTVIAPQETRASIRSVFSAGLLPYTGEGLRDMMCQSDFQFADLLTAPTALFLIVPPERKTLNPLVSVLVKQSYDELADLAFHTPTGALPRRVNYVLDEFTNIPAVPDLDTMVSAARSLNIRFCFVVQNYSQLVEHYSQVMAETILNNCECWMIFRNGDLSLHKILAEGLGERRDGETGRTEPLFRPLDLQCLSKERGEVLIRLLGCRPFVTSLPAFFEYPKQWPLSPPADLPRRKPQKRPHPDVMKQIAREAEEEAERHLQEALEEVGLPLGSLCRESRPGKRGRTGKRSAPAREKDD